jgi:hypothetical protein
MGDEVDLHLVEQPGLQILPHDVPAAPDSDILVASDGTGKSQCGLGPIRHEGLGCTALHGQGLSLFVSHYEDRHPEWRLVAPRLETDLEHPLPNHDRPGRGIDLIHDRGLGLRFASNLQS